MSFTDSTNNSAPSPSGGGGFNWGLAGSTFNLAGGAVSDIFAAMGDKAEAGAYTKAAGLARLNEQFTEESTAVKEFQTNRQIFQAIGGQQADVAGAGFASSGTALDLLRDSAAQGALAKEMVARQGLITEAGYQEQAQAYDLMAQKANMAAEGSWISGGIKAAGAVASTVAMFAGA